MFYKKETHQKHTNFELSYFLSDKHTYLTLFDSFEIKTCLKIFKEIIIEKR